MVWVTLKHLGDVRDCINSNHGSHYGRVFFFPLMRRRDWDSECVTQHNPEVLVQELIKHWKTALPHSRTTATQAPLCLAYMSLVMVSEKARPIFSLQINHRLPSIPYLHWTRRWTLFSFFQQHFIHLLTD